MKDNVSKPNDFVHEIIKKEIFAIVNVTLQMTQAPNLTKIMIGIIFYVCLLHLTPNMTIIFPIHSLHLANVAF
jgi:hypothetical protein